MFKERLDPYKEVRIILGIKYKCVAVIAGLGIPLELLIPSIWDVLPEMESLTLLRGFIFEKDIRLYCPLL